MLKDLEAGFLELEKRITLLQKNHIRLRDQFESLQQDYQEISEKYVAEREKNAALAEEHQNIKIQAALAGNPEHNRLMKSHLNRLIKEIDLCVAQLSNAGL